MNDPVTTPCYCPGKPHERDEYQLADELSTEAGIAAATVLATADGESAAAAVTGAMMRNGVIIGWNLVDEDGQLLPITAANVGKRVTWLKGGIEVGGAVLQRFVNAKHLNPLASSSSGKKSAKSSRNGRTARSTSPKTPSSVKPLEPSE